MKNDEKGYLTVEATISLTSFLFFMMFLMNFGQIYQAQNYMIHGLAQTGKSLAFSSYEYKNETTVSKIQNFLEALKLISNTSSNKSEIKLRWKGSQYVQAVKKTFPHCAGTSVEDVNKTLKSLGLEQGMDSIDFSGTKKEGDDLFIQASYDIDLPFPFFQVKSIKMQQQIVCRLWE